MIIVTELGDKTFFIAAVLAMRQAHGLAVGGKSDMFFLCALRAEAGQEARAPPPPPPPPLRRRRCALRPGQC